MVELHEDTALIFDCHDRGKVAVTGKESARFLHNLCSNDVVNLESGQGREAFFLTVKARVVAHAFIYRIEDGFWLDVAPGQGEKLRGHLDRYLISEIVEIADRTAEFAQFHVAGPGASELLQKCFTVSALPEPLQQVQLPAGVLLRRQEPLGAPGFDLVGPVERKDELRQLLLSSGGVEGSAALYESLRIEACTPHYGVDFDENTLALEVGRTSQAISFQKGCYLGQEPVVRTRDLGHVNRTLLGVVAEGAAPLTVGAKLYRGAEEVGLVTSATFSQHLGQSIALAYIRRGCQEPGTKLEADETAGRRPVAVSSLPFSGGFAP